MRCRIGFTLIELLAALAISTLLIVSLMGMTARLSSAARQIKQTYPIEDWQQILEYRLQTDYRSSRSIVVRPTEIIMDAKGIPSNEAGQDAALMELPMRIRYSIQSNDEEFALVRTEQTLFGDLGNRTEFMLTGITGFRTDRPLATDVAPGILGLEIFIEDSVEPVTVILMRHGMRDQ